MADPIVVVDKEAPAIIVLAKEKLIKKDKVKKGGEKAPPKKREIKEARKQSNICRKDTEPDDEGVDVYD